MDQAPTTATETKWTCHIERAVTVSDFVAAALRDGHKTQARWPVVFDSSRFVAENGDLYEVMDQGLLSHWEKISRKQAVKFCPHRVGERLWVRERYCIGYDHEGRGRSWSAIPWTGADRQRDGKVFYAADRVEPPDEPRMPWIHGSLMPRWACRTVVEVTETRIQRLWDISEKDAEAEGVLTLDGALDDAIICAAAKQFGDGWDDSVRGWFMAAWSRIHRGEPWGWEYNPWVWAETFRKVSVSPTQQGGR